jgi:CubicO group peptidase (beta-lactamase class C family)
MYRWPWSCEPNTNRRAQLNHRHRWVDAGEADAHGRCERHRIPGSAKHVRHGHRSRTPYARTQRFRRIDPGGRPRRQVAGQQRDRGEQRGDGTERRRIPRGPAKDEVRQALAPGDGTGDSGSHPDRDDDQPLSQEQPQDPIVVAPSAMRTPIVWHNGGTGGYRTWLGFDKSRKVAAIVLTNSTMSNDDLGFELVAGSAK